MAAFFTFQDRSALDQACAMYAPAKNQVDLKRVTLSKNEGKLGASEEFARRVRESR